MEDPLLPWRMLAETVKLPVEQTDWFPQMCEDYARLPSAFWNDWWLFDDTPFKNREPTTDERHRAQIRVLAVFGVALDGRPKVVARQAHGDADYYALSQLAQIQIRQQRHDGLSGGFVLLNR